jgi:hypothetical protein
MNKKLFLYFLIASHITQCNLNKKTIFASYILAGFFGYISQPNNQFFEKLAIIFAFIYGGTQHNWEIPKKTP